MIGEIAEHHLSPESKKAVHDLLGHQTLADVSSWADDIRSSNPGTSSLHFIDLPTGLSFDEFKKQVETQPGNNAYKAILGAVKELRDSNITYRNRANALRFLVHFVGDIHQPMHVSRPEDRGGNSIAVSYKGYPANLHSVWDYSLLADDGDNYHKLAGEYDQATPAQIKKWQGDPVIIWAWESYQISSILYREVEAPNGAVMGKEYYESHIPVVRQRIDKAGIRLAGLLNEIFAGKS